MVRSIIRLTSHVDGFLIVAQNTGTIDNFVTSLELTLDVERKGIPQKFLGIECTFTTLPATPSIKLSQTTMIHALCKKCSITYGATSLMTNGADLSELKEGEYLI
jgi:hypothetical protein